MPIKAEYRIESAKNPVFNELVFPVAGMRALLVFSDIY
jgi:hypothetical protein